MKLASVPRARTALTEVAVAGQRHIGSAEHHIRTVGGAAQGRLVDRNRIEGRLQIGRWIISGAIVLIVGTTPSLSGFARYYRCRLRALSAHRRRGLR